MIVVYHQNNHITKVVTARNESIIVDLNATVAEVLMTLAYQFPEKKIVWCHQLFENNLNIDGIETLFHHNKMMLSYDVSATGFLGNRIGFVEESPFININKKVTYPTWQMSSTVGVLHASVLNALQDKMIRAVDFDYFLCSLAKLCMPKGLLCYSEPKLVKQQQLIISRQASIYTLFKFVKQHYKKRWVFLLLLNLMVYQRKFPFIPMVCSFFHKSRKNKTICLDAILVESSRRVVDKGTLDVIIPTIGREDYLYNVLIDFSKQTRLPHNIIIIEQNPEPSSNSKLEYIYKEKWPFGIQHFFIHQSGACNARNLALNQVKSEWVFLSDDDIRIPVDFIEKAFDTIHKFGVNVLSVSCLQKGEKQTVQTVLQWGSFGSGSSIVAADSLKKNRFTAGYEFGYGEDSDFGMQLRNQGNDVLYLPYPKILHLKAPVGGFRIKPVLEWHKDKIQPKPSPTVMLYILINNSKEQLFGYKTTLFFKYYKHQKIKNPYSYFIYFQKQWNQSVFWANQLKIRL